MAAGKYEGMTTAERDAARRIFMRIAASAARVREALQATRERDEGGA